MLSRTDSSSWPVTPVALKEISDASDRSGDPCTRSINCAGAIAAARLPHRLRPVGFRPNSFLRRRSSGPPVASHARRLSARSVGCPSSVDPDDHHPSSRMPDGDTSDTPCEPRSPRISSPSLFPLPSVSPFFLSLHQSVEPIFVTHRQPSLQHSGHHVLVHLDPVFLGPPLARGLAHPPRPVALPRPDFLL